MSEKNLNKLKLAIHMDIDKGKDIDVETDGHRFRCKYMFIRAFRVILETYSYILLYIIFSYSTETSYPKGFQKPNPIFQGDIITV